MDKKVPFSSLNIDVYCETEDEITERIETFFENGRKTGAALHFAAAAMFVEASRSKNLLKHFRQGIIFCDSRPMFWYLKRKAKKRVQLSQSRGTGYMRHVWKTGTRTPLRHFLIAPNEETADELKRKFTANRVSGRIVGHIVPTFTNDIQSLFEQSVLPIRESKAQVVWIGIGAPKQIFLASRLCDALPIIALTVGAAFEIVSGTRYEAPKLLRSLGLEWFFRWTQEPKRLMSRYTIGNLRFVKILIKDAFMNTQSDLDEL